MNQRNTLQLASTMAILSVAIPSFGQNPSTSARIDALEKQLQELKVSLGNEHRNVSKHHFSGYLQLRFDSLIADKSLRNENGSGGSGQRPTNGGPFVGGPASGFLVRRGRLRMDGPINEHDKYVVQLDFGNVGAVNLRDAFADIKTGLPKNTNLRIGQFPPHFSYTLAYSSRIRESPERPLGFSDSSNAAVIFKSGQSTNAGEITPGSVIPLFNNQDRDGGAAFSWSLPKLAAKTTGTLTYGLFNGEGRDAAGLRNLGAGLTGIARAEAVRALATGTLTLGTSRYRGGNPVRAGGIVEGKPAAFVKARRNFDGVDARYVATNRAELRAEVLTGTFEQTPDRARFLANNKVAAWYATGRYPISKKNDFAVVYDEFRPTDQTVAGVSARDYERKTIQIGVLHQLAPNSRFRLWYSKGLSAFDPSAPLGSAGRKKVGVLIGELQVEY